MIDIIFELAGAYVLVRIEGTRITFANSMFGAFMAPIEGLKLSQKGVIKEFPDLENNPEWNKIAIERFKEKIKAFLSEEERATYIVEDFRAYGYKPMFKQKSGFRREVLS